MELLQLNYKHQRVVQFIGSLNGKNILDVGGGQCRIMRSLPQENTFYSLEINKDILPRIENVTFIVQDAERGFPFKDDSIDVCIFTDVLEHLYNPDKVVSELHRCCRVVVVTTPNNTLVRRILLRTLGKNPDFVSKVQTDDDIKGKHHVREYSWKEVKDMFEKHGFILQDFRGIGLLSMKVHIDWFPRLSAKMLMKFIKVVRENEETVSGRRDRNKS